MRKTKTKGPLDGYIEISKQERADLKKMSAEKSLTLGFQLIKDIENLAKVMKNGRDN